MRARLVHNPSAGMRTEYSIVEAAMAELSKAGWQVELCETHASGDATRLAREAAAEGCDAALAVGGDGTVNEVLNGLLDSQTALGVLPYGTANVWAKEMGLPLGDMAAAARLLTSASIRLVDVGVVEGESFGPRAFILWCGIGFDAQITAEIEPQRALKRRFGALMFWLVGVRSAFTFRGRRARFVVDGRNRNARVLLALASNVQLYGGIVRMSPDALVDDGLLDFVIFKGTGAGRTAWHLIRVFFGWHLRTPDVEHFRAREIVIRSQGLPVHIDAEPVGHTPARISIRPAALRALVPSTANSSLFAATPAVERHQPTFNSGAHNG